MANNTRAVSGGINPYAADAVVFDTQPIVNFALQQEAKKKAAQDVVDKHLQESMMVDYSKMRTQDQAGFLDSFNRDVKDFYIANRDVLRKNNTDGELKRMELQQRIQRKKAEVGQSLQYAQEDKEINDYNIKLKEGGKEISPQTIDVLANRGLSMYDKKFYKNDFTKETYKVGDLQNMYKDFNDDEWVKDITAGKSRSTPIRVGGGQNIGNFGIKYNTEQRFTDKDYNDILGNAGATYDSQPRYKEYFDNQFHKTGNIGVANVRFKNVFGRDIQSGKDAAIANALMKVQKSIQGEQIETDVIGQEKERLRIKNEYEQEESTKLLTSMAKLMSGKELFNVEGKVRKIVNGEEVYDITNVFGNNIRTKIGRTKDSNGNSTDDYLTSVNYVPRTGDLNFGIKGRKQAEMLFGQDFVNLYKDKKVTDDDEVVIRVPKDDKGAMKAFVNGLAVVNGIVDEKKRKKITSLFDEPQISNPLPTNVVQGGVRKMPHPQKQ